MGRKLANYKRALRRDPRAPHGRAGERNGNAKLDPVRVMMMRYDYANPDPNERPTIRQLAEREGVSYLAAYNAIKGHSWKHLPMIGMTPDDGSQTVDGELFIPLWASGALLSDSSPEPASEPASEPEPVTVPAPRRGHRQLDWRPPRVDWQRLRKRLRQPGRIWLPRPSPIPGLGST